MGWRGKRIGGNRTKSILQNPRQGFAPPKTLPYEDSVKEALRVMAVKVVRPGGTTARRVRSGAWAA
eukprot:6487675-Amphidinium_carterae.1